MSPKTTLYRRWILGTKDIWIPHLLGIFLILAKNFGANLIKWRVLHSSVFSGNFSDPQLNMYANTIVFLRISVLSFLLYLLILFWMGYLQAWLQKAFSWKRSLLLGVLMVVTFNLLSLVVIGWMFFATGQYEEEHIVELVRDEAQQKLHRLIAAQPDRMILVISPLLIGGLSYKLTKSIQIEKK